MAIYPAFVSLGEKYLKNKLVKLNALSKENAVSFKELGFSHSLLLEKSMNDLVKKGLVIKTIDSLYYLDKRC